MSEKPKKKRFRGAAGLWLAVVFLAVVYLGVWSVDKTPGSLPQKAGSITVPPISLPQQSQDSLSSLATQDAASRAPGAQIKVLEVKPTFLVPGPELRETTGDVGEAGAIIVLGVVRDDKLTERITYRALPPDQVVFVEQKPAT